MPYFNYHSKRVHYVSRGDGEVLIILPGNTASSVAHQAQMEVYGENYFVVSPDYLGVGRSDRLDEWDPDWWEDAADQVMALIKHLNCDQASVMGTSGGSVVAMHLAARHPQKVRALVLDSFTSTFRPSILEKNVIQARSDPNEMQRQFWEFCHGSDWEEVVAQDTQILRGLVKRGGDWLKDAPEKITCPVLLIGSKEDGFLPNIEKDYHQLAERIKDARVKLAKEGGHPLMWTNPEFFNSKVMRYLRKLR